MRKKLAIILIVTCVLSFCAGCSSKDATVKTKETASNFNLVGESIDYSDPTNWCVCESDGTKDVDTIFIYPTIIMEPSGNDDQTVNIDDTLRQAAAGIYEKQAKVYEKSTNLYMPLYRQIDMESELALEGDITSLFDALSKKVTRTDVYGALDYYFEHYNNGKPFILAGHSQGSALVRIVLDEYMEAHPEYYERMVAAYAIGMSISQALIDENDHLKFAEGETDTGVIITWNTEGPGATQPNILVSEPDALCINPLTWTVDDTYGDETKNKGVLVDGEVVPGLADAQIDLKRNTLISNGATSYVTYEAFGDKSLHASDYSLFWGNIEENVQKRIDSYLENAK